MLKKCSKCQMHKPLSQFYPRKDAKDGRRGTCIECWLAHYRPAKRASYAKHKERLNAEKRARRAANPEPFRLNDMRYYLRHRKARCAANRAYHRKHRDRLIEAALARRKRNRSLDYGWTSALGHDRVQFTLWRESQSQAERRQTARESLGAIVQALNESQRKFLAVFQQCEMDLEATARRFGMSDNAARRWLLSIRRTAKRAVAQVGEPTS